MTKKNVRPRLDVALHQAKTSLLLRRRERVQYLTPAMARFHGFMYASLPVQSAEKHPQRDIPRVVGAVIMSLQSVTELLRLQSGQSAHTVVACASVPSLTMHRYRALCRFLALLAVQLAPAWPPTRRL